MARVLEGHQKEDPLPLGNYWEFHCPTLLFAVKHCYLLSDSAKQCQLVSDRV